MPSHQILRILSVLLSNGICFVLPLCPMFPSVCLAVNLPLYIYKGGNTGLPRSTRFVLKGLGPFFLPAVALTACSLHQQTATELLTILVQAFQHSLACFT